MIVHEPNPWALLSLLFAPPRIPFAIWFHSDVIRPWLQYRLFYAPVARPPTDRAARFVVSSPALGKASAVLKRYADRIAVIPFGIDADAWTGDRGDRQRAARFEPPPDGRLCSSSDVWFAYKGVDVLFKAAAPLPVQVVIVGDGPMAERGSVRRPHTAIAPIVRFSRSAVRRRREGVAACGRFWSCRRSHRPRPLASSSWRRWPPERPS